MSKKHKFLIVGGGAGGAILANILVANKEFDVTLINDTPNHYYWPQLLQIAFRGDYSNLYRPLGSLLAKGVNLLTDRVEKIDLGNRKVSLKSGSEVDYDYITIAPGITIDHEGIAGNEKLVLQFGDFYSTPENASKVYNVINNMNNGTFVISVGDPYHRCPPSPYEGILLADEVFRMRGVRENVRLVIAVPYPRPYPAESFNEIIEAVLKERGIEVMTFFTADSIDVEKKTITSLEGETISYDAAIVVPMHKGPKIEIKPEGVTNEDGLIVADKFTNQVSGYDDAFAIGDASTSANAKTGVTAHLQAKVVARRVMGFDAKNTGRTNCPTEIGFEMGTFVISDYEHPPAKLRPSVFNFIMKRLFADAYWDIVRHPEFWDPIFDVYFENTSPEILWKILG
ncbi:MAG: NAD(P)/FAD-dependent oxidoreductase [Caldisphaeraceae archaeon]|nr:NAD(P)/FAD-dependent oxidoreductase [Caldisphaeraceae archaeon]MEB3691320.1 NAD(P)/FAD-dependent oxidoreductase [Caldisphaeraceae archaeon]MEB3797219.1 NAD(P)/FAD-dependent oxidoreductase [Caldisphaeraceae archaeon]